MDPFFFQVALFNSDQTQKIFLSGYKAEKNRMKDIDLRCNHHKYKSINFFCRFIEIIRRKSSSFEDNKEMDEDDVDEFTKLIGNGFCRKCSIYIVSELSIITGFDTFLKDRLYAFKYEDIDDTQSYFTNCMQYPSTANYIFNQSNLWNLMMLHISILINDINQREKFKMPNDRNFHNLAILLFQILRNLKMIKKDHWKLMVEHQMCLMVWLSFIKLQLKCKSFINIRFGKECMFSFLVLITFSLYYMKKKSISIIKHHHNFKGMKKWFHDINKFKPISSTEYDYILNAFLSLENRNNLIVLFDQFKFAASEIYSIKKSHVQCQNINCDKTRCDVDKLYKCSSCQVARYCCKQCQKQDWKKNNHKRICNKLTKNRKSNYKKRQTFLIQNFGEKVFNL